jgi:hypothetical protein
MTTTESDSAAAKWSEPQQMARGVMMNKPTVTKDGRWLFFAQRAGPCGGLD